MMELKIFGIILAIVTIIYGSYKIPKTMGWKKLGIILSTTLFLIIITPILGYIFEDYLFTENDALEYLNKNELYVTGEIDIKSNKITGLMEYYQEFSIELSDKDKTLLIDQLKSSEYLINHPGNMFDIRTDKPRHSETIQTFMAVYETEDGFEPQSYRLNKKGYTPQWDMIRIPKTENIIYCSRVED